LLPIRFLFGYPANNIAMKKLHFSLLLLTLLGTAVQAQVTTDPVGFLNVTVPANSDAIISVPLNRAASFKGMIQSISGNVMTIAGTSPAWTANLFVQSLPSQIDTYAVLIASGTNEGMTAKITANGANTLTVQLATGDNLSAVKTEAVNGAGLGDQIDIMPYWTPSSLISSIPDGTEMYAFDNTTTGQNVSPTTLLQFFTGFGWYETVGFTDQSNRPMPFGTGFILRNNSSSSISAPLTGSVPMSSNRLILRTLAANTNQDQTIGYMSPVPTVLGTVNLGAQDNDELYLFDNSASGKNKSPSTLLIYFGGLWYNSLTFADVTSTTILQPGNAMIYRKKSTSSPQNFVWQNLQSYLQ
jgi:uncharacterized protein (TIGR02597 family)